MKEKDTRNRLKDLSALSMSVGQGWGLRDAKIKLPNLPRDVLKKRCNNFAKLSMPVSAPPELPSGDASDRQSNQARDNCGLEQSASNYQAGYPPVGGGVHPRPLGGPPLPAHEMTRKEISVASRGLGLQNRIFTPHLVRVKRCSERLAKRSNFTYLISRYSDL